MRILAATNRDLEADVSDGRFRQDLLFRLNTIEIIVPPLRERREDIVPLAHRFLALLGRETPGAARCELSAEAEAAIVAYDWPGNIRELRNAMERAAILAAGPRIGVDLLPERIATQAKVPHLGGLYARRDRARAHRAGDGADADQ